MAKLINVKKGEVSPRADISKKYKIIISYVNNPTEMFFKAPRWELGKDKMLRIKNSDKKYFFRISQSQW